MEGESQALRMLLEAVELGGAGASRLTAFQSLSVLYFSKRGADFLIPVKFIRRRGFRLICARSIYCRRVPRSTSKGMVGRCRDIMISQGAIPTPVWVVE